jgi:hypothetical protein
MATEAATRAALYRLIDELPEAELHAARRYLEYLAHGADQVEAGATGDAASAEPPPAAHDANDAPGLRAPVAEDLRLRDAIRQAAEQRGQGVEERHTPSGHVFRMRPPADEPQGVEDAAADEGSEPGAVRHIKAQDSATMTEAADVEIRWLDDEDSRALFDEQARKLAGVSGEEFLHRWDAGDYDAMVDDPSHPEIMRLAALIPFGR